MKSFLIGYTSNAIPSAGTNYYQPMVTQGGSYGWSSSFSAYHKQPLPHAITLDRLRVKVDIAPGVGNSITFTVLKNGVATALTCTISGTNTTAQDLTDTVSFAAGDTITFQANSTGTIASVKVWWTARQDATGLFAVLGGKSTTATGLVPGMGMSNATYATADAGVIIPCAGTISNLYINATGSGPVITIYKNGSVSVVTLTLAGAAGSDTTHSFTVAAGDRIAINNATTGQVFGFGFSFAPTNDGDSFIGHADNGHNTNNAATAYYQLLSDGDGSWDTTESNTHLMLQACTITALYSQTSVSPGASPAAYTFTVMQNSVSTAATVTINDSSGSGAEGGRGGSITGQSISINDDDFVEVQATPSGSPLGVHAYDSMLIHIAVVVTNTETFTTDAVVPAYYLDQDQLSKGSNFGFGQGGTNGQVKYRGQKFTPTNSDALYAIGFDRVKGTQGIKVYIDTITAGIPTNNEAGALYAFTIPNSSIVNGYGIYTLPIPLQLTGGTEYCFYLAPWDTSTDVYSDDYQDVHGISTSGSHEITYVVGSGWSQENLKFHYATFMLVQSTKTFTVDGIIQGSSTSTKTFTADGIIFATNTKTFTADGIVLVKNNVKIFTLDGMVLVTTLKTFTADGIIFATNTKTFTADGVILVQNNTKTFTADGLVLVTNTKTFTADGIVAAINTLSFTVDGEIKVSGQHKTFTADGVVLVTSKPTFTVDGYIVSYSSIDMTSYPSFWLGGVGLKNPKGFRRDYIYQKTDYLTLTGKSVRDLSHVKEKYTLVFENLTPAQVAYIESEIKKEVAVNFQVITPDININTTVWPYSGSIVYDKLGSNYLAKVTLEMIEVL